MPYMMMPDDYKVVADAIYSALSHPKSFTAPVLPQGEPATIAGIWDVQVDYLRGRGVQRFLLQQSGDKVRGAHQGEIYSGNIAGTVHADQVILRSALPVGGNEIPYNFTGTVQGNSMSGTVALGEYGHAQWSATKNTA
jgi:hypothetical protein